MARFRQFGSARFVLRAAASVLFKVLAGAVTATAIAYAVAGGAGAIWVVPVGLVIAAILVFAGVAIDAGMGQRVHQKKTPLWRLTQVLLEEYWTACFNTLVERGHWDKDLHVRFVVYVPLRYALVGRSYLIAMHYLDRDETRNSDEYVIDVRTRSGWAGQVFATGQTMVADLERSGDLIKLYLTEKQEEFVLNTLGLKSKICVPLMAGPDSIVGVFSVESRDPLERSKFQDPQIASLIENVARSVFATCSTAYNLRTHHVGTDHGG